MKSPFLLVTLTASLALTGCFDLQYHTPSNELVNNQVTDQVEDEPDSSTNTDEGIDLGHGDSTGSDTDTELELEENEQTIELSQITFPETDHVLTQQQLIFIFHEKERMWLHLGTTEGANDIFNYAVSGTEQAVDLPAGIEKLFATLWTSVNGVWEKNQYVWTVNYTTGEMEDADETDPSQALSRIIFPVEGSIIREQTVSFQFENKATMWLDMSRTVNGNELVNTSISGTSFQTTLPEDLNHLYLTLWTLVDGTWQNNEYDWVVQIDSSDNNGSDISVGKNIWEQNCTNSACHSSGAVDGVFSLSSLNTKGITDTLSLANYVDNYMPLIAPESCIGDCATDVASYIATWHSLPEESMEESTDTGNENDDEMGSPRNPVVAEQCNAQTSIGYQAIRLLTREQYQNTVEDLLGYTDDMIAQLPVDLVSGAFTNNNDLSVLDSAYIAYVNVAETIAQWSAEQNFSNLLQCNALDQSCATALIDDEAWKIFRRPLTSPERQSYVSLARGDSSDGDIKRGMQLALSAMLSSPQFLYRHEIGEPVSGLGNDVYQLTQYELATFLSYAFANTTPDEALLTAARNNQLETDAQIESHVSRLLDSQRANELMGDVVHSWLDTDFILSQSKDASQFPNFDQVAPSMVAELSETFSHIMLDENEEYESLYSADYAFLNESLSEHYGVGNVSGSSLQKVYNQDRGGILLTGAFLSRWAHTDETNAVTRSVHIRRDMLCQDIPEPPTGVSLSLQDKQGELADVLADPKTTQRMAYKHTTEFGSCSSCHNEIINPLGFGLEDFDAVGVKRSFDANGNAIDSSGALWSPFLQLQFYDDPNRVQEFTVFEGGKELGELLATEPKISGLAKSCLAKQMMSYVSGIDARSYSGSERENVAQLGVEEKDAYTCDVIDLVDTLSNESPRRMLEKLGTLESIRYRKAWSR